MRKSALRLFVPAFLLSFFVLGLSSCEKDPCEDAICAACPSSRLVIQYQDSLGDCPPAFHANAWITGIDLVENDTTLRYNFSDSCQAGFLIRENYRYIVSSGSYRDVIDIVDFDYQEPIEVTECCLCYPVEHVDLSINGDSVHVEFPAGKYENEAYTIMIN